MNLKDKLRKAATYFVVPTEEEAATPKPAAYNFSTPAETSATPESAFSSSPTPTVTTTNSGQRTVEDIVRESDGPNLDEIKVSFKDIPPPQAESGTLDFGAIYANAGLPSPPFSAEQTLEMLASLPANLPMEMKRQTVQATIGAMGKAIGVTTETIVADASRKLAAIAAYAEAAAHRTEEMVATEEATITELLAQVEAKRRSIVEAKEQLRNIQTACVTEVDHLDDILEFFSLDVSPSRYASPPTPTP